MKTFIKQVKLNDTGRVSKNDSIELSQYGQIESQTNEMLTQKYSGLKPLM